VPLLRHGVPTQSRGGGGTPPLKKHKAGQARAAEPLGKHERDHAFAALKKPLTKRSAAVCARLN
jgi:hypothetical protein